MLTRKYPNFSTEGVVTYVEYSAKAKQRTSLPLRTKFLAETAVLSTDGVVTYVECSANAK